MTTDHNPPAAQREMPDVLLVEDNESDYLLLLRQVQKHLAPRRCHHAANRDELMTALGEPWDLIITDLHLTDIEEQALLSTIASIQPDTPCLVLSGTEQNPAMVGAYGNIFASLLKGDSAALRAALTGNWRRPA